jgi:hypothetical protein
MEIRRGRGRSEAGIANTSLHDADDRGPSRQAADRGFGLDLVRTALAGLRFGEVRVIVQDGVIVQIERVEKQRLR